MSELADHEPVPAWVRIAEHAHDAVAGVGRLRRVWPMLGDARLPGRPAPHLMLERRMSPEAALIEDQQVRRDRRAKMLALRSGKTPLPSFPAPVRLGPVRTRARIAGQIRAVGGRVHAALPARLADPTLTGPQRVCPWCHGAGRAQRPNGWTGVWPGLPPAAPALGAAPACSMCGGHGRVCSTCNTAGGCWCDLADVVVDACLDAITTALASTADPALAEHAAHALNGAADLACHALGLRDVDMRIIRAPCPACDRRDLWADVASPKPMEWSVVCRADLCRCTGPACGCGRPTRWSGRRHRWPADEFGALADRLGVLLPIVS